MGGIPILSIGHCASGSYLLDIPQSFMDGGQGEPPLNYDWCGSMEVSGFSLFPYPHPKDTSMGRDNIPSHSAVMGQLTGITAVSLWGFRQFWSESSVLRCGASVAHAKLSTSESECQLTTGRLWAHKALSSLVLDHSVQD